MLIISNIASIFSLFPLTRIAHIIIIKRSDNASIKLFLISLIVFIKFAGNILFRMTNCEIRIPIDAACIANKVAPNKIALSIKNLLK